MCRCRICNRADFDTAYCVDDLDLQPKRNSVHYYADLKDWYCSYCYRIIMKNRKFYNWHFQDDKQSFREKQSNLIEYGRAKQKNQKATLKVPEMS
jgi:hypothetical protein